ncbi:hypothetical protein [Bacillus subtilis]|uniref:hypothetical protein n=1 Tax=Bacillus subtilis TaxID=1423 RepID=UPI0039835BC5
MTEKIIDVPENADYITAHEQINAGGSFLLQKYNVVDLPDAPTVAENATVEKRVVEVPVDDVDSLENAKSDATDVSDFIDMLFGTEYEEPRFPLSTMIEVNTIADWYLHPKFVEFVPKKEKTWVVERKVNGDYKYVGTYQDGTITFMAGHASESLYSEITNDGMIKTEFTEELADEIIAGLGGEDGLLKLRKVEVQE